MEIRHSLSARCPSAELFDWVEDLGRYPQWMQLVHDVEIAETQPGEEAAWNVELQARVGPFARSKRLRMVRSTWVPPHEVVFERAEIDGRSHSSWVLRATIQTHDHDTQDDDTQDDETQDDDDGADSIPLVDLTMELHYGGGLWSGVALQHVLDDEVSRGSEALVALVSREPKR